MKWAWVQIAAFVAVAFNLGLAVAHHLGWSDGFAVGVFGYVVLLQLEAIRRQR